MPTKVYHLICWITIFALGCYGQQCSPPVDWVAIAEEEYDRNATSVKPGGRPLGYEFTTLPYAPDGNPNPCYKVGGTTDKRVEIMAEPHGGMNSKICVRSQNNPKITCADGQLTNCGQANADTLYLEFFCDTGCDQSDVAIWVRFVVSPDEYDNDPEKFCEDRIGDDYPSTLIKPPPVSVPPIRATTDAGTMTTAKLTLLIFTCFLTIILTLDKN